MKPFVRAAFLALLLLGLSKAKLNSPKVQVYSHYPGNFLTPNTIICHVSDFYPPQIQVEIIENGKVIPGAHQTDLAFEDTWHYYMTKHVAFTPKEGDKFACRVTHAGKANTYIWEPDM